MTPPKTLNPSVIRNALAMWSQEFLLFFILIIIFIQDRVIYKGFAKPVLKK